MDLTAVSKIQERKQADLLVLPFWHTKHKAVLAHPAKELSPFAAEAIATGDFQGKEGETTLLYMHKQKEKRLLLLGLGEESKVDDEALRRSYATAIRMALKKKCSSVNLVLPNIKDSLRGVCEGALLANYSFDALRKETPKEIALKNLCFIGVSQKELAEAKKIATLVDAVNFARDLVNGNADDITPQRLCHEARHLDKQFSSVKATIFDKPKLEKMKMGLLLAVGKGSAVDPALIVLEYRGDPKSKETTAIVGKGITYDTGGLLIKPRGGMETMKCDMAGGAAVMGTIRAAAALKLKCNLVGVVATTENAVGPSSYKPGDVYVSYTGKTVEISDTDAEGRLVLADAVAYVQQTYQPKRIIDLATLTGGVIVALGEEITGIFSNDDTLTKQLVRAGESTGERLWRLPLYAPYRDELKSSIADIKNSGNRNASAMKGALFIQSFLKKGVWAHLDIAGSAYLTTPKYYNPSQATGVGIRLLIDFLQNNA